MYINKITNYKAILASLLVTTGLVFSCGDKNKKGAGKEMKLEVSSADVEEASGTADAKDKAKEKVAGGSIKILQKKTDNSANKLTVKVKIAEGDDKDGIYTLEATSKGSGVKVKAESKKEKAKKGDEIQVEIETDPNTKAKDVEITVTCTNTKASKKEKEDKKDKKELKFKVETV